jgi:hypothetical protein
MISAELAPSKRSNVAAGSRLGQTIAAEILTTEYHEILDRAISIVMAQPFLMNCRKSNGDTFHHLDIGYGSAVLTWCRDGKIQKCHFPSFLLDLGIDALSAWQRAQNGMHEAHAGMQPIAPMIKCAALGIGLPAIFLMKRGAGLAIGTTKAFPNGIAIIWSGIDRAEAETAFDNAVKTMMAEETSAAERLGAAGCNADRDLYLKQEQLDDADPDQTPGGIDRHTDEQPERRA